MSHFGEFLALTVDVGQGQFDMSSVQFAVLWGHEHPELGVVAVEEVSPGIELALSRGKFPKGYPHLDPNENAVTAATDGVASLLAVSDGHSGHDAGRAAMEAILIATPSLLTGAIDRPREALQAVFQDAKEAVRTALDNKDGERAGSRTALSIALLGPDRVTVAGLGDSRVVLIRDYSARIVGSPATFWMRLWTAPSCPQPLSCPAPIPRTRDRRWLAFADDR